TGWIDDIAAAIEGEREVRNDPTVLKAIVENNRVTKIICVAQIAKVALAHERVERESSHPHAVAFSIDPDRGVHCLDEINWANIAIRIGWMARTPVSEIEAVKACARRRGRCAYRGYARCFGFSGDAGAGRSRIKRWIGLRPFAFRTFTLHRSLIWKITKIAIERISFCQTLFSRLTVE